MTGQSLRRFSFWLFVVIGLYVTVTFVQVVVAGRQQVSTTADAVVVMGAAQYDGRPSPQLQGRLTTAIELWREQTP
ncbi:MAG: hypothetical protein ACO35F_10895, partial [Ilumatobacteraceae bacterium]